MAQPGSPPGDDDAKFEDDFDEVLSRANPNPERVGCPPAERLIELARPAQPIDHPCYEHLLKRSYCYRHFMALTEEK